MSVDPNFHIFKPITLSSRSPAVVRCADRTAYIFEGQRPISGRGKKENDFPESLQSHTRYNDAVISNATINNWMQYGYSVKMVMTTGKNFAFKIAAKPLQIGILLLLKAII